MEKRYQLNNGTTIPQIGFGTWQVAPGADTLESVTYALTNGYDHVDTALIYGNEVSVGEAIKQSGRPRSELFITSKLFNDVTTYDEAILAVEKSLKQLDVDYIDLYLIHWPNPLAIRPAWEARNREVYRALEDLYTAGKLKAIGVSNFWVHHLEALAKTWRIKPQVNQIFITPGTVKEDVIAYCQKADILVEAYSPLGRGHVLTHPTMLELSAKYHKTPAQLAVKWCLQQGFLPLVRSITPSRIIENIDIEDFTISEADLALITALSGSLAYDSPDERNY